MAKFSDLAVSAMSAYESVAQAEYELEQARERADKSADAVKSALEAGGGKVALVNFDGDVSVYTLDADGVGYKVETIRGDFDVPDPDEGEPTAPVEPEGPNGPDPDETALAEPLPVPAWLDPFRVLADEFAVS